MQLDQTLKQWLVNLADSWQMSVEDVSLLYAESEIENRINEYPKVKTALDRRPFDLFEFASAARECWILHYSFDAIRFTEFVSHGNEAESVIEKLTNNFPQNNGESAKRIESFLEDAILLGYSTPTGGFDWAGAAQLASLILTAVSPNRFVDYRRSRWVKLAKVLDYPIPKKGSNYGECVIWAGKFAADIVKTETFQRYWPTTNPKLSEPLWVISGLCWGGIEDLGRPITDPIDPETQLFPEGAEKRRLHLSRERNRKLVEHAKALFILQDPNLHCEVCGFSYVEHYGELGRGFIEAHHTIPIAELKKGGKTSVSDLAMLCANCHRMIHRGERTLAVKELKNYLETKKDTDTQ